MDNPPVIIYMARDVLEALAKTCNEKSFVLSWEFVKKKVENLDVDVPQSTLHNNTTKRMKNYFGTPPHLCQVTLSATLFEVFDNAMQSIKRRFDQKDFKKYLNLQ